MKKKSLLIGIIQIVLSIGIFCGSGILGHLEYNKSCRTKDVLAASTKQAALFEKGTVSLEKALSPVKKGVDSIVKLRNNKVLAPVGQAFAGLQKSCDSAYASLEESRLSFNKVANMQIEYEYKYDIFGMICLIFIFVCAGIALLGNGIYLCTGEKSVKIIVLVFAMALGLFLILAGFYAYRHVEGYLSEKIHEIKMQQEEKKERLEEEKKRAAAEERLKKELSETDENGEQKPEKTGKQLIEQLAEQQRTAEAEAAAALKVAQEKAEAARRAAEAKAKAQSEAEAKAAEARIIAEAKAKAAETEALLIADAKRKAAEEKNRLIAEAKAKAERKAEEERKAAGAERKAFENSLSQLVLPGNVALEMVKIKAGTFTMGSPEGERGRFGNEKQHRVTLTQDYWLGKFEVTQAQYEAVMGNNPSFHKGSNRPVDQVSWEDAKKFCDKLNDLYSGKLPAGYRFDLPTEAQWEYACRAGTTTALNNGKNLTSLDGACYNLNEVGWYDEKYGSGGHKEVGQKLPNAWGLYDMHGNVEEWCRDWYDDYHGDATDPTGPSTGSGRVHRGGGYCNDAKYCRSAHRGIDDPGHRSFALGFRVALMPVR